MIRALLDSADAPNRISSVDVRYFSIEKTVPTPQRFNSPNDRRIVANLTNGDTRAWSYVSAVNNFNI